jgi:hypothetical protein
MVLLGLVVDVEVALPFQLGAVGEMVESVTHLVRLLRVFFLEYGYELVGGFWAEEVGLRSAGAVGFQSRSGGRPPKGLIG